MGPGSIYQVEKWNIGYSEKKTSQSSVFVTNEIEKEKGNSHERHSHSGMSAIGAVKGATTILHHILLRCKSCLSVAIFLNSPGIACSEITFAG
jgi:hypothetical protein